MDRDELLRMCDRVTVDFRVVFAEPRLKIAKFDVGGIFQTGSFQVFRPVWGWWATIVDVAIKVAFNFQQSG